MKEMLLSIGLSMDANYGFPCIREVSHCIKFGTCAGYKTAVVVKR